MKKLIVGTLVAMAFNVFSPVMPLAHAGVLQDQLMQTVSQDANIMRIQQVLAIKKQLEQGNKQELLKNLATVALGQSTSGTATAMNAALQGNIGQVAQDVLLQELQKKITEKIAPYGKELGMLATLLNKPAENNSATIDNKVLVGAPQNYKRIIDMTATAYAPGSLDNGKWRNQNYVGGKVERGIVAVDPNVIPMGTKLWVEGYGLAIANDQGSAIKGNRIDLAFDNRSEALDYGIKKVKIYVLN